MARILFRQGIVSYPKNDSTGEQEFLERRGDSVDLVVNSGTSFDPVSITFIHQDTDYIYFESRNISDAWTDVPVSQEYWLYWDINLDTGELTRNKTNLSPIISPTKPKNPDPGQMWFDTREKQWYEFFNRKNRPVPVIRVFAAKTTVNNQFESMSIRGDSTDFGGTQVGALSDFRNARRVGSLVFNKHGKAIKSGYRNQFFTTEDKFLTGVPNGASNRINNIILTGIATCPIPAFTVVEYDNYNDICPANPARLGERIFGITQEDYNVNEIVSFDTQGLIYNELWDWFTTGAKVNDPVYVDQNGAISLKKYYNGRPPIGVIVGKQEIYFAPRLFPQITIEVSGDGGLSEAQLQQLNDSTFRSNSNFNTLAGLSDLVTTLQDDITALNETITTADLSDIVRKSGDTMLGDLTLQGAPTQPLHAATKEYIDDLLRGFQVDFTEGFWNASGNAFFYSIPQNIHNRPLNTLYEVSVVDDLGNKVSTAYQVNQQNGTVTITTTGEPFAGTVRIK